MLKLCLQESKGDVNKAVDIFFSEDFIKLVANKLKS